MALLWKMICNLGDPMSLRHLIQGLGSRAQSLYIESIGIRVEGNVGLTGLWLVSKVYGFEYTD